MNINLRFLIFIHICCIKIDAQTTVQNEESNIKNIFLNLEPGLRLTRNTPVNTLIATVSVSTTSNSNFSTLQIVDDDPFFYLIADRLYLRKSLFDDQQYAIVTISALDIFNSENDFVKYFLLPIENEEYSKIFYDNSPIFVPNISIKFDLLKESIVAQLYPLEDELGKDYEYSVSDKNDYLDITEDGKIFLKQKLGNEFLKYTNPYLKFKVDIKENLDKIRKTEIWFKIDTRNQPSPALVYDFDKLNDQTDMFFLNGMSNIRLGQFKLDENIYPADRYTLRAIGQDITLDDEGNLFIPNKILSQLNSTNSAIEINIIDSEQNSIVLREIFQIEIPSIFNSSEFFLMTTISSLTVPRLIEESMLECNSDIDCNQNESGPNVCLQLSNLKNEKQLSYLDLELLFRRLQFVSNKDLALLLKYYRVVHGLRSNSNQFIDELDEVKLTKEDIKSIGICLCDSEFTGFKCRTAVVNTRPYQCHPKSLIPSCNPNTSKCQKDSFSLTNAIKKPLNQLNNYASYTCECERDSIIGLNCEFTTLQCFTMSASMNAVNRCEKDSELCYPLFNNSVSDHICLEKESALLKSSFNYLTFDESNFLDSKPNTYLDINNPNVLTGIQSFIRDNVFMHYSFNNYNIIPKGPLAILNPSISMPDVLNSLRNRVNTFTSDLPLNIQENLMRARIDKVLSETISSLISQGKLAQNPDLDLINNIYNRLNIQASKNSFFSYSNWNLFQNEPNLRPLVKASLEKLRTNSEKIKSYLELNRALSLVSSENPYLDLFDFNGKAYNLVKMDILPGIYMDLDGELSVRPTPGVYLKSEYFIDPINKDREFIFMPGIFNPASGLNCEANSIFLPGIFAHQIDNFDLDFLKSDMNKYLNKFVPMQIPFNINSMLTPLRTSLSETVHRLIANEQGSNFESYVLWTPLDFNPDSTFDLINKNEKFMSNLFSTEGLSQVVNEQKQLNLENLISTLLLSDPSTISQFYAKNFSLQCISNNSNLYPLYNPSGIQFFNITHPSQDVSIFEYVLYGQNGQPVPQKEVYTAINSYCSFFLDVLNEFHSRICAAMNQTNLILTAGLTNPNLCQECSFDILASEYYTQSRKGEVFKHSRIPIWVLFLLLALFALLWIIWLLLLCCCCLKCCPLFGLCWKRSKAKVGSAGPPKSVATNKSFKYFVDDTALSGMGAGFAGSHFQKNEASSGYGGSNTGAIGFVTKRIPVMTQSLVNLAHSNGSQGFLRSSSFPNLSQNISTENHQDIRAISHKGFISNSAYQNYNNANNLIELKRISNHVNPNTELSFTLANDGEFFSVDRKIANNLKTKSNNRGFLFNCFQESEVSNTCSEATSSEYEMNKACFFAAKRKCCYCKNRIVCPERIESGCDDAVLMCDVCYCYVYPKERMFDQNFGKNQNCGYYIVRNKDRCSNSYGKIIDVVNLDSCASSDFEAQSNKTEIQMKGQTSSSDVNEYDEISLDTKSCNDISYKPNVHRMFKNNKIIVVPSAKKDEKYYYAEDSF